MIKPEEMEEMQRKLQEILDEIMEWRGRGLGGDITLSNLQWDIKIALKKLDKIRSV